MLAIDLSPGETIAADRSTTLLDAAKLMRDKSVGDVVVTLEENESVTPIGVVTDRDIVVHAIASGVGLEDVTVGDLCTRNVATCRPEADLSEVAATMNQKGVRRLLLMSGDKLVGIVSMDDVIGATAEILNNLTALLVRQIESEKEHIVPAAGSG